MPICQGTQKYNNVISACMAPSNKKWELIEGPHFYQEYLEVKRFFIRKIYFYAYANTSEITSLCVSQ